MSTLAVRTDIETPRASDNLLTPYANFNDTYVWNILSGGGNAIVENNSERKYLGKSSCLITFTDNGVVKFNNQKGLGFTCAESGKYIFALGLFKHDFDADAGIVFKVEILKNNVVLPQNTLEVDVFTTSGFVDDSWNCYFQSIELQEDDVIDFNFYAQSDTIGAKLFFDRFKVELDDRNLGFPSYYTEVPEPTTIWQSRTDTTNSQSLTANTNNLFAFAGTLDKNTDEPLISALGIVTPTKLKDTITIDYSFNVITPSGTDRFIDVLFIVNGVEYRATTIPLLKGAGNNQHVSGSWTLPVGLDFMNNAGAIYLNPNSAITINTRYISVVEQINY
jgi:hypothetical protein